MLRGQFGKAKEDSLKAIDYKDDDEQCWYILARSRTFVDKFDEAMDFINSGLRKVPESPKLLAMKRTVADAIRAELNHVRKIELIKEKKEDKMMKVYRNLRSKGVKLGKKVIDLPEVGDARVSLDKHGKLHFPVLILYDEFMVTDFIEDFQEDERLAV